MSARKAILIHNPKTGRYTSRRVASIESVCTYLRESGLNVELKTTVGTGDATTIASIGASTGATDVIVAGGDGTINEALQGLIGKKSRVGILPRGTANVLARELGVPLDTRAAADVIVKGQTRRVHVGVATNGTSGSRRYFFLMAGIGLDASVVRRVHPTLKKHFGKAAFWFSGFSHLADWKPKSFEVMIDNQVFPATFAAIGKGARYGGDLAVTPRAQLDQPEFEVCLISSQSRLRYLSLLPHVLRDGVPVGDKYVSFVKTSQASATGEALVQVDGEVIGKLPMSFSIAPETIEMIV